MLAFLTGHTCGDACWHARELVCRCSCGGANHGILNTGGKRPTRTCRIGGNFYELVGIVAPDSDKCAAVFFDKVNAEVNAVQDERFPGLDYLGYGAWREESTMPVVDRKISDTQAKWPEVQAVEGARRLIWSRPAGTRYLVRGPNHTIIYNEGVAA